MIRAILNKCADVSTHSRLKAAGTQHPSMIDRYVSFNTQPPKGGWIADGKPDQAADVSTHSRLKAAGYSILYIRPKWGSFNTQPPKGGWRRSDKGRRQPDGFNTQPPKGGWASAAL